MELEEKIEKLEQFKRAVLKWSKSYHDKELRTSLRSYINQNKAWVRQEVIQARCFHTLTISPPPAVGGLIMQNVDPFSMLFDAPYGLSMVDKVIDMIDQTIGVLKNPPENVSSSLHEPKVTQNIDRNYAFIAMAIDENNPELEDILDAIKEGALRCGIQAERIDEDQSNERITDRILESIARAEFVIVDLTNSRPNVFYEAGYAHGIGKIPIYLAKEGTKLEFDLKDYPVIFFKNMKQLKDKLEARLRALSKKRG